MAIDRGRCRGTSNTTCSTWMYLQLYSTYGINEYYDTDLTVSTGSTGSAESYLIWAAT